MMETTVNRSVEDAIRQMEIAFYQHGDFKTVNGIKRGNQAIRKCCERLMKQVSKSTRTFIAPFLKDPNPIDLMERVYARRDSENAAM